MKLSNIIDEYEKELLKLKSQVEDEIVTGFSWEKLKELEQRILKSFKYRTAIRHGNKLYIYRNAIKFDSYNLELIEKSEDITEV